MTNGKKILTTMGPKRPRERDDGTRRQHWHHRNIHRIEKLANKLRVPFHSRHASGWRE